MRRHGALRRAAEGIAGSLPDLAAAIYLCIHRTEGRILDEASEKLGSIRVQRQENLKKLRAAMEGWAREMHRKGAAERSQVLCMRVSPRRTSLRETWTGSMPDCATGDHALNA